MIRIYIAINAMNFRSYFKVGVDYSADLFSATRYSH